ncbi:MAG: LysR family transcriptional regulator [Betaproteobacteria bacterium]|nr:LysR family transcriptional regulator [Betaproteobacteria bacterium]
MRFDLFDLDLFACIAASTSLTKAAQQLHVSTPSVSARVKNLEDGFGVKLLNRGAGGITLTAAGQIFLQHAQIILQESERMRRDLQEYSKGTRGTITILGNTTAITEFLPPLLRPFLVEHPEVVIDLREHPTSEIAGAVNKGVADIGLIVGVSPGGEQQRISSWADHLVLVVPAGHPLAARRTVAFRETLDYEFVLLSGTGIIRTCIDQAAAELKRPLKVHVEVGNFEAVCRMVENNMGISVLPKRSATRHANSMKIDMVKLSDPWAVRRLQIVVRDLDSRPAFIRQLVELLVNERDVVGNH